jgi:hypothetical protein
MRSAAALAVCLTLALPALARADAATDFGLRLLDASLTLSSDRPAPDLEVRPELLVARAAAEKSADQKGGEKKPDQKGAAPKKPADQGSLDFDLLGAAPAPSADAAATDAALKTRRKMLTWHQGLGLTLVALEVGTTVLGQLSYNDKFSGTAPANTNKYRTSHAVFAISTLGVFAANGIIALLAPAPGRKLQFDRVMVHRVSMALAAVGMAAQAYYGFHTSGREGYQDQASIAKTHLVIGYATFAAFATGVGVLAF